MNEEVFLLALDSELKNMHEVIVKRLKQLKKEVNDGTRN